VLGVSVLSSFRRADRRGGVVPAEEPLQQASHHKVGRLRSPATERAATPPQPDTELHLPSPTIKKHGQPRRVMSDNR
jgi:hypothetical protein